MNKFINFLILALFLMFNSLVAADLYENSCFLQERNSRIGWGESLFSRSLDRESASLSFLEDELLLEELEATANAVVRFLGLDECLEEKEPVDTYHSTPPEIFSFPACSFCSYSHHPYFNCFGKYQYLLWRNYQQQRFYIAQNLGVIWAGL